jgi:APA family basic amino acid/polyamine antiporter
MASDGLYFARAGRLHPRYQTPVFALWFQAAVSLVLLSTNTYDQLLSYVVFADWLFFGLTAASLFIARRRDHAAAASGRDGAPRAATFMTPGHPWTTGAFVLVAAGVVVNTFFVYPIQSAIGAAVLLVAAAVYYVVLQPKAER